MIIRKMEFKLKVWGFHELFSVVARDLDVIQEIREMCGKAEDDVYIVDLEFLENKKRLLKSESNLEYPYSKGFEIRGASVSDYYSVTVPSFKYAPLPIEKEGTFQDGARFAHVLYNLSTRGEFIYVSEAALSSCEKVCHDYLNYTKSVLQSIREQLWDELSLENRKVLAHYQDEMNEARYES